MNLAPRHVITLLAVTALLSCTSAAGGSAENTVDSEKTEGNKQIANHIESFSADTAMAYILSQVNFGPRVPETEAHDFCADFLARTLSQMGFSVDDAPKQSVHPITGKNITIRNIFAQYNPEATDRILILAHYDTRPYADADANPANHNKPIDGANDGASGVAVALETARLASSHLPDERGLDILFTDWEDSGDSGNDQSWCIGSTFFADNLPYSIQNRPKYAVLLDMVGGKNAVFPKEAFSEMYAPYINKLIWDEAARLGYSSSFINSVGGAINDDHVPLLKVGIPAVDIIETRIEGNEGGFNHTWHTLNDNIENIDPSTLKIVGDVITNVIYSQQ